MGSTSVVPESTDESDTDLEIIKAVIHVANKAFEDSKDEIIAALNREILDLGIRFGIARLEEINLSSSGQMGLVKGDEKTSFSKLTPGERLRIRLATAIALLRIGKSLGVGRHPGLLIVDSPGSEELTAPDLAKLLMELKSISEEIPQLQVFIASHSCPRQVPNKV